MIILGVILGLYIGGSVIAVHLLFSNVFFGRNDEQREPPESGEYVLVRFPSGKNTLQGYLYGAENDRALVVIAHGLGGSAESFAEECRWFTRRAYRVFVYDCTGTGASEGKGTNGTPQSALDLDAALDYIEGDEGLRELPVLLYGHSWGGYAAAAVLDRGHGVKAAVSISGYDTPMGVVFEESRRIMGPLAPLEFPFMYLDFLFRFGKDANRSALRGINASGIPILIIHGTADKVIRFDGASIISRRDKITNPGAEFLIRSMEGQNGHNDLFLAPGPEDTVGLDENFMNAVNGFYEKNLPPR